MSTDQYFHNPLIVYKVSSKPALKAATDITKYIFNKKMIQNVYIEDEYYDLFVEDLKKDENLPKLKKFSDVKDFIGLIDLCIIIGGDGTLLWANSLFGAKSRPPFLTFNLGTLGYMTYYHCEQYVEVLEELLDTRKSNIVLEKRSTLSCRFVSENEEEKEKEEMIALNDIVVNRGPNCNLLNLEIYINNELLTSVKGDGVLMASSTGSTAYNLSAGGTIVHYDIDCLLLNAICPHSLSFRPIAFPNNIEIKILVGEKSCEGLVSVDGNKKIPRKSAQGVIVKVSDFNVNLILLERFTENAVKNWKKGLINQLGWNKGFKNI